MRRNVLARLAFVAAGLAPLCSPAQLTPSPEQQLSAAVEQLRAGRSVDALRSLESLTQREPNFRLAHLLYGELLSALSGGRGETAPVVSEQDERLQALAEEARVRLASERAVPPEGFVPNAVLQLAPAHKHLIAVDLPRARLYILENGAEGLKLVRHHYAAMGKNGARKQNTGDQRTPVGVYKVTGWIGDRKLPELYGAGAFPVNYPNLWDQFKRRTGFGIWLHGVPRDTYSRPPRSSEGCVTMANDDLLALKPFIHLGQTPVVLSDEFEWVPPSLAENERKEFLARIEDWRARWSAKDTEGYLAHYAGEFTTEGMGIRAFADHKRRVNVGKKFIDVKLSDINLFRYPGADQPLVLAEFTMEYRSDNYNTTAQKQQYWIRDTDGEWRIFREANR